MFHFIGAFLPHLFHLSLLARAGGGGSSGGGSSGGGGGGGIIALLSYVPAYVVSSWCNRHISRVIGIVAGCLMTIVIGGLAFLAGPLWGVVMTFGAILGVWNGINNALSRILRQSKVADSKLQAAASSDPIWNAAAVQQRVQEVFMSFQRDWSHFNLAHIRTYTTDRYFNHVSLMLAAMHGMGRRNDVQGPSIDQIVVIDVQDSANDTEDRFKAYVSAQAHDRQVDLQTDQPIYVDDAPFTELWNFQRVGNQWLLDSIDQATADKSMASFALQQFAAQNNMYYSLDWGWLLLPQRGQLFGKANFKNSDINNHVIGQWGNLIVQLYTYIPFKAKQRADNYLVGQINLPKSYGGILVLKRGFFSALRPAPRGYTKVKLEWGEFNKRYDVYATDMERVTSFELLNPAVMSKLYDVNLPINIEVVDNIVYFYCLVKDADQRYPEMLDVLQWAYRELRM